VPIVAFCSRWQEEDMGFPDETLYARNDDDDMEDYGDISAYDESMEEEYEEEEEEEMGEPAAIGPSGSAMTSVPAMPSSKPTAAGPRKAAPKKKPAKKKKGGKKAGKKKARKAKKSAKKRGKKKAGKKGRRR
jgi:hypothetical protein